MAIAAVSIDSLSGLTIKDYTTIRAALQDAYRAIFGTGINLDPSAPDGQLVDLFAYAYTELAQALQTVTANMDRNTAEGVFLDYLANISGLTRKSGESDTELRARMAAATFDGLATFDSMLTYLRQNVASKAGLDENTTAHTFAVYVPDGFSTDDIDDDDEDWQAIKADTNREATAENFVAQKIWNCKPAGIPGVGSSSGIAVDAAGNYHTVKFSQVTTQAFKVRVTITEYTEERLPADYKTQIAEAIAAWALDEFIPGKDVIPGRFRTPIYENVQGVDDITVSVAKSGTEDWSTKRVPVGPATYATIDAADVEVTLDV